MLESDRKQPIKPPEYQRDLGIMRFKYTISFLLTKLYFPYLCWKRPVMQQDKEDIYFFEVDNKYILSNVLKMSSILRVHS